MRPVWRDKRLVADVRHCRLCVDFRRGRRYTGVLPLDLRQFGGHEQRALALELHAFRTILRRQRGRQIFDVALSARVLREERVGEACGGRRHVDNAPVVLLFLLGEPLFHPFALGKQFF